MKTCCIQDCKKPVLAKSMCAMHYARMRNHGDPMKVLVKQIHGATLEERFEAYVKRGVGDECWEWVGAKDRRGYGRLHISGTPSLAHRVSYAIHCEAIAPHQHLLHSCDNPSCVNPSHLSVGTQADNNKDMFAKGRGNPKAHLGEKHGMSKLTPEQVLEIRERKGSSIKIGAEYGVSGRTIREIRTRQTWRHL